MQKITCAIFNGYSLMIASYYQILRKLFVFLSKNRLSKRSENLLSLPSVRFFDYPLARSANKYCFTKLNFTDY